MLGEYLDLTRGLASSTCMLRLIVHASRPPLDARKARVSDTKKPAKDTKFTKQKRIRALRAVCGRASSRIVVEPCREALPSLVAKHTRESLSKIAANRCRALSHGVFANRCR